MNVDGAQNLGPRLIKPVLPVPSMSPQVHRKTQVVCTIDRVQLGMFRVSARVVKPAFVAKQLRKSEMKSKQLSVPVERGSNSES